MKIKRLIILAYLFLSTVFTTGIITAQSGIYAGGPVYKDRNYSINELKNSGFTHLVVWTIHIDASGNFNFNAEFPLIQNGAYVGGTYYPNFVSDIGSLKSGTTSINRIDFCISAWGSSTFSNIRNLINSQGIGSGSILYRNFQALKNAFPTVDAIAFDDESTYDVNSATALAVMLADIGFKVTLVPYTSSTFWTSVANNTNSQRPGTVDRVDLQCYAGGAGNNPCNWNFGSIPLFAGLWDAEKSVSQVESQLATWKSSCGIDGGFMWLYDDFDNSSLVAQYASAINNVFPPVVNNGVATFYQHCSYGGYAVSLPVGNYNMGDLQARGIVNDDISSVKVNSGYQVIAYWDINFTGSAFTITGNNDCLVDEGWNDQITSVRISTICTPTAIVPFINVNNGGWQQTSSATLSAGGTVSMGPQPSSGGSWRWSGPNGYISTSREITISNIQTNQAGNYVATYTNDCGATSTHTFSITVTPVSTECKDITDLGGTITSQYSDWPAGEDKDNLIDNDINTKYLTFHASAWVQYKASGSFIVTGYTLTSANDAPERDPRDWNLQGSNDGINWTDMDVRSGEDFPNRFQTRGFNFSNSSAYSYYRFNMSNNSGSILQFAEIELCGTEVFNPTDFTVLIEAENYSSMSGVQTETCSEGGLNVGWIDAGDFIVWDVNLPVTGQYTIEYRVASLSAGGTIEFEKAGGSPNYGTINVPVTGGWQSWTTISHLVNLDAGTQQVAINVLAGGWNINWLQITYGLKSADENISVLASNDDIIVYPNPVTEFISIKGIDDKALIRIYNMMGQLMIETYMNPIDVSKLIPGTYILGISSGNDFIKKIFIK